MITVSTFLRSGVLMVWGIVLSYFYFTDRVNNYLHPSFHIWTGISGIVFILIAFGLVFLPGAQGDECCDHDHGASAGMGKQIFGAIVLSVPLVIAATFSPGQFGASVVENRGLANSAADLPGYQPQAPAAADTAQASGKQEDYTIKNEKGQIKAESIDLVYAAEDSVMREDFENKEVEMIGQYLPARTGNPKGDRFNLVRMYVVCCAADARPVAVSVQTEQKDQFPEMGWVKVVGKATFPHEGGRLTPVVVAEHVEACDPPDETFVY